MALGIDSVSRLGHIGKLGDDSLRSFRTMHIVQHSMESIDLCVQYF